MVAKLPGWRPVTLGADKAYDTAAFVRELRDHRVTPHVAQKPATAIDRRTSRHPGYAVSQQRRKRIEEAFGWLKTVALLRKTRHRGVARVGWMFTFAAAALQSRANAQSAGTRNLNGIETPASDVPTHYPQSLKPQIPDRWNQRSSRSRGIFPHPVRGTRSIHYTYLHWLAVYRKIFKPRFASG